MIVENVQSKRKTENRVSFRDGERFFGAEAEMKRTRNPTQTFWQIHEYIGKSSSDEAVKEYMQKYFVSYEMAEDKVIIRLY